MIKKTQSLINRRKEDFVDKNNKRKSLIQSKKIDEKEHVVFFYHIKTLNDLMYWVNKNVIAVNSMLIKIKKENVKLNNFYNVIVNKKAKYEIEYERLKKRVEKLENENVKSLDVFVELIRNALVKIDVSVSTIIKTSKKLFDLFIFIDDKNSNIEDWLSTMKNKLKENANWFSIETSKKVYVRIQIDENAMKYLFTRFKKNFIKSFLMTEKIFNDLNRVFDDFNKKINALKTYKQLKQIESNKEFHIFWTEFQRLTNDSEFYDEEILLKDLKNKMFWDSQKVLTSNIYKRSIYMNLLNFVNILIKFFVMWKVNSRILIEKNIKNRSRKIIWIIRNWIASNRMHQDLDLKHSSHKNRIIVKWAKHSISIKLTHLFVTIATNLIIWHATASFLKRWIRINTWKT